MLQNYVFKLVSSENPEFSEETINISVLRKSFSPHVLKITKQSYQAIYMFKVNNKHSRAGLEICSELSVKTTEQCLWRRSVSLLITLNRFHTLL